ncbi:hypothetical protein AAMO2058_000977100 [Amorphochlora amoebiformis]
MFDWVDENPHSFCLLLGVLLICFPHYWSLMGMMISSSYRPLLTIPICLSGVVLFHPTVLGWFLTIVLRYTALNGFLMTFGSIHLWPSISGGKLDIAIVADDVGFGNPPDFPHEYFVQCKKVSLRMSMPLFDFLNCVNWTKVPWSPFPTVCRDLIGGQDGVIHMRIQGLNIFPPGFTKGAACYVKVKTDGKTLLKTEMRQCTPGTDTGAAECMWEIIKLPYSEIKHNELIHLTVWDRSDGSKHFRGELSLSVEDIKSCTGLRGRDHILLDKNGSTFSDTWKTRHKDSKGQGVMTIHVSASLQLDSETSWGVWESKDFVRPYCIVYDRGVEIARTEIKQGTINPRWKSLQFEMKDLSATSVVTFEVWSFDDGPDGGIFVGTKSIHISALAAKRFPFELTLRRPTKSEVKFAKSRSKECKDGRHRIRRVSSERWLPEGNGGLLEGYDGKKPSNLTTSQSGGVLRIRVQKKRGFRLPTPVFDANKNSTSRLRISEVTATGLASRPSFLGVVDFEHIEFDTVMLNFETHRGEFNVNGVTRMIAEGEMSAAASKYLCPPVNWPNCLEVKVIRARELRTNSGGIPSPSVTVQVRRLKSSSETHVLNANPLFDDKFRFPVTDPSSVVHVFITNKGMLQSNIIGHWVMTLKWLFVSPSFCHHNEIKHWKNDPTLKPGTIRGWFPLLDPDFKHSHSAGEVEMEISWKFVEGFGKDYKPPRTKALDQLTENSNETKLRLGEIGVVEDMLHRFPLLFRVNRVTIRNVTFFLKDLFLGYKGASEKKGVKEEALKVDFLESSRQLQLKGHQLAHTLSTFMQAWVKSLIPQVVKKGGLVGSATSQILFSLTSSMFDFSGGHKGKVKKELLNDGKKMKKASVLGRTKQRLHTFFQKKKTRATQLVTAHDTDYFLPPTIKGIIEKRSSRIKKWVWAIMELKGCTLFYADCDRHGKKLAVEKKLDLSQATNIQIKNVNHKEIVIHTALRTRYIRVPVEVPGPSVKEWYKAIMDNQRRDLSGMVKIVLIKVNGLPPRPHSHLPHLSHGLHVTARVVGTKEIDRNIKPVRSKSAKVHAKIGMWKETETLILGPLKPKSKTLLLDLDFYNQEEINRAGRPPVASIFLPLTALTDELQQFTLPWAEPKENKVKRHSSAVDSEDEKEGKEKVIPPKPRNRRTVSDSILNVVASPMADEQKIRKIHRKVSSSATNPPPKSFGTLVFKAQRLSHAVMYKRQLYVDPGTPGVIGSENSPVTRGLSAANAAFMAFGISKDPMTPTDLEEKRRADAVADVGNASDRADYSPALNPRTILSASLNLPRKLWSSRYPGKELHGSLDSITPLPAAERHRTHSEVSSIATDMAGYATGVAPMSQNNVVAPSIPEKAARLSDAWDELQRDELKNRISAGSKSTTESVTLWKNRSGNAPEDGYGEFDPFQMETFAEGEHPIWRSVVLKFAGPFGSRKHQRVLTLTQKNLYNARVGKGKTKHGKIPLSEVVDSSLLKNKGPNHFEIRFKGSQINGKRHYVVETPEEAEAIVKHIKQLKDSEELTSLSEHDIKMPVKYALFVHVCVSIVYVSVFVCV